MNRRDVAQLLFRAVALWFSVYSFGLFATSFSIWYEHGPSIGLASLAVAMFFMIGAVATWAFAPWLSSRIYSAREETVVGLTREDLWSTVVFGIGVLTLARALPRVAYWLVVWVSASGTDFWMKLTGWRAEDGVVYSVAFSGQFAEVVVQLVLGAFCVLGPESVLRALTKFRKRVFRTEPDDNVIRPSE